MTKSFSLIAAVDEQLGIGNQNQLPWRLSGDMAYFKKITAKNIVIMGRKTWESIPEKFRPLSDRLNVILCRKSDYCPYPNTDQVIIKHSLEAALNIQNDRMDQLFVIGGASLYHESINHPLCNTLYITQIHKTFDCDSFFPSYKEKFNLSEQSELFEEHGIKYQFEKWICI